MTGTFQYNELFANQDITVTLNSYTLSESDTRFLDKTLLDFELDLGGNHPTLNFEFNLKKGDVLRITVAGRTRVLILAHDLPHGVPLHVKGLLDPIYTLRLKRTVFGVLFAFTCISACWFWYTLIKMGF